MHWENTTQSTNQRAILVWPWKMVSVYLKLSVCQLGWNIENDNWARYHLISRKFTELTKPCPPIEFDHKTNQITLSMFNYCFLFCSCIINSRSYKNRSRIYFFKSQKCFFCCCGCNKLFLFLLPLFLQQFKLKNARVKGIIRKQTKQ